MADTPTWVDVLGFVVAAGGFGFGVYQYREGRLETRRKFAAESVRAFKENICVQAAGRMLDWGHRKGISVPVPGTDKQHPIELFDHVVLAAALLTHEQKQDEFSGDEAAIRDVFDVFIDELEMMAHQEAVKAIALEDVAPYLRYVAQLVRGERGQVDKKVSANLTNYMNHYWGGHVLEFLDRCRSYRGSAGGG